jgi:U32 family peptidase
MVGENLRITARAAGLECVEEYPLGTLEPSRTSDMEGALRAQFEKCGDTPFMLGNLSAP